MYNIYLMYIYIYIYIYALKVLKVKSTITRYVKCFVLGISTSRDLFKEL